MEPSPTLLAQIEALTQGFNQNARLGSLSPELLAYLAGQQGEAANGGLLRGFTLPDGRRISQYGQYALADANASPDAQSLSTDPSRVNWNAGPVDFMLNTDLSNKAAMFDPSSGQFLGYEQREDGSSYRDFLTAAALILGGYYGGTYLSEAYGGAGAAEGLSGMDLAADAAYGSGNNVMTAGEALSGTAGTAGTTGVNEFRQGEIQNYQTDGSLPTSPATTQTGTPPVDPSKTPTTTPTNSGNTQTTTPTTNQQVPTNADGSIDWAKLLTNGGGWGNIIGGLLGAYAGYQGSKDKENTTRTEPWGPAQPYLQGLLQKGAGLYDRFEATPFSDAERAAYGNQGNVLDYINANAPGLMSGFDATAAGRNQFVRGQPRGLIGNSYDAAMSPVAWRPSLLGDFGTTTAAVRRR